MRYLIIFVASLLVHAQDVFAGVATIEYPNSEFRIRITLSVEKNGKSILSVTNQSHSDADFLSSLWLVKDVNKRVDDFPLAFSLQLRRKSGQIVHAGETVETKWGIGFILECSFDLRMIGLQDSAEPDHGKESRPQIRDS